MSRADNCIRLGCRGAVSRPKEEIISLLPGLLPLRRTNGIGGGGGSVALFASDEPISISVALPILDVNALGRPSASQASVDEASTRGCNSH